MKILLIAGHGGNDTGACAFGRREADLTRQLLPLVAEELRRYGVTVEQYDRKRSAYHDIIACGYDYNFKRYDYVLEIHFNAYRQDPGNGKTRGTEIYVPPDEKITTAEEAIVRKISALGLKNRGVKRSKMAVIMRAKAQGVSAALLEVCFMDDGDDMKIYDANQIQIAQAIADGIAEGYRLERKNPSSAFRDMHGHWADAEVAFLASHGVANGYANGIFAPDKPITRAEAAVMLRRAIRYITGK